MTVIAFFILNGLVSSVCEAQTALEYNELGIVAFDAGRYEDAITYFDQALRLAPESEVAKRNYTNALRAGADGLARQELLDNGIEYLETALRIEPENPAILLQLGSYYLRKNQINDAIFRLEEAVELKPGDLDAHELLGQAYYLDNDLPSARAQWEYVLEVDPERPNLSERYEKAFREEAVEADFNRSESRHFRINYPHGIPNHIRSNILTILERAYMDIGRRFNGVYPTSTVHVIIYTADQFSEATQLESHVGAIYDGKIRIPLTDENNRFLSDSELKRRLIHEYVHVVVREIAGDRVPWWLNEGLAETLSKNLDQNQIRTLQQAYKNGRVFSLRELENHQLKNLAPDDLRIAYLQSHAVVTLLWNQYGNRRVINMLEEIAGNISPEESIRNTFRKSYNDLESELFILYGK